MKRYNYHEENNLASPRKKENLIHEGMPELEKTDTPLSFFEFWPGVIIYTPVAYSMDDACHSLSQSYSAVSR